MIARLAILTNGTLPLLGGAERTCWDRSRRMARLGPEVLLLGPDLAPEAHRYPDRLRYVGPIEARFTVSTYPSGRFLLYADNRQPRRGCGFAAIESALTRFRPDLLLVVEPEGLTLLNSRRVPGVNYARRAGIPVVFENHTQFGVLARDYLGAWAHHAVTPYLRSLYRFADAVLCFSNWNAGQLRGLDLGRVEVHELPFPAVDLSAYSPANRTRPRPGRPTRILYAGRFAEEKRLALLVEAVGKARRAGRAVELRLAGAGPMRPALEEQIRAAGLSPQGVFTGVLREAELATLYADADLFVNPCPVETFGLAALEALASGTPVAVPVGGGQSAFVREGVNGRLIEPLTCDKLAQIIISFCDDPAVLPSSEACARSAAPYSLDAVCRQQLELLELIRRRKRRT